VGLGKDFSGNGNYFTTNNISITTGSTYDSMTDVPTLTSATASNFAVVNPLNKPFTPKEDVLDDLQAAINLFSKSNTIDTSKIFLLGHGEGAYWAPYVANVNKNIKGIILMGANANHPLEMMIDQNNYLSKILPHKKEHYDEDNQKAKIVLKRKIKESTPASDLPHDIPAKYWFFVNSYDQVKVAKRLKTPIFIIQGGRDYQVDKKNFFVWQKKLKNKSNVSFKLYQNMNHIMHEGVGESTYSEYSIMRHIPALVIDDLVSWLNKN
jgi:dienelactone hydrolase